MAAGAYGRRLARAFHATCEDTAHARTPSGVPMAVTRLRSVRQESVVSNTFTTEDAYLVVMYLEPPREFVVQLGDGSIRRKLSPRDTTLILDLQKAPRLSLSGGFHSINIYLPRRAIFQAFGAAGEGASLRNKVVCSDPVLSDLARALFLASADARMPSAGDFTQHMLMAVCARLTARYRGAQIDPMTRSTGLTQEKRDAAVAYMRRHLDAPISMIDVAVACGLSYRVFVRAFKRALGTSPYDWFMASRIERSKELMADPTLRLADIAGQMGFADQSHFNRAFLRYMGVSPGAWRRCGRPQADAAS
jgi:AraC family transcriptional regulator